MEGMITDIHCIMQNTKCKQHFICYWKGIHQFENISLTKIGEPIHCNCDNESKCPYFQNNESNTKPICHCPLANYLAWLYLD